MNKYNAVKYAELINTYLYLIKNYGFDSVSKIIYTTICLDYCKKINCSTTKKNDVMSFYFSEAKKGDCMTYNNLKIAINSMQLLIDNHVVKSNGRHLELINKDVTLVNDKDLEKVSIQKFLEEVKNLSLKSFLTEVYDCV